MLKFYDFKGARERSRLLGPEGRTVRDLSIATVLERAPNLQHIPGEYATQIETSGRQLEQRFGRRLVPGGNFGGVLVDTVSVPDQDLEVQEAFMILRTQLDQIMNDLSKNVLISQVGLLNLHGIWHLVGAGFPLDSASPQPSLIFLGLGNPVYESMAVGWLDGNDVSRVMTYHIGIDSRSVSSLCSSIHTIVETLDSGSPYLNVLAGSSNL